MKTPIVFSTIFKNFLKIDKLSQYSTYAYKTKELAKIVVYEKKIVPKKQKSKKTA